MELLVAVQAEGALSLQVVEEATEVAAVDIAVVATVVEEIVVVAIAEAAIAVRTVEAAIGAEVAVTEVVAADDHLRRSTRLQPELPPPTLRSRPSKMLARRLGSRPSSQSAR